MKSGALLSVLVLFFTFNPAGDQQTGEISGRVITEDGAGMPNINVNIFPVNDGQSLTRSTRGSTATTDDKGNFRFTGLARRLYQINVFQAKDYAVQPPALSGSRYYRVGEAVSITLVKGGVITGKVTTPDGDPAAGIYVTATLVRDADGFKVRGLSGVRQRMTDDRGIYRLYGLPPGTYIVSTRGGGFRQTETYYPSATRETADEVRVTNGGEATGIDLSIRSQQGHVISGTVTGGGEPSWPYTYSSVTLYHAATGFPVTSSAVRAGEGGGGYALSDVEDGEYEIIASRGGNEGSLSSLSRRVTVKGADLSGVDLALLPMAFISGRVVIQKSPAACEEGRKNLIEEILITTRRDLTGQGSDLTTRPFISDTGVSEKGEFTVRNLLAGRYHFEASLPGEGWYVKSISVDPAARGAGASDAGRAGMTVKAGESAAGLIVTVADGAASLSGKVVAAAEGSQLPPHLRIQLVPAEAAAADDLSRYREILAGSERTFFFKNLPPGRYWLLARIVANDEVIDRAGSLPAWDKVERAKLRKEAEAKKVELELKPCQRSSEQILKY